MEPLEIIVGIGGALTTTYDYIRSSFKCISETYSNYKNQKKEYKDAFSEVDQTRKNYK